MRNVPTLREEEEGLLASCTPPIFSFRSTAWIINERVNRSHLVLPVSPEFNRTNQREFVLMWQDDGKREGELEQEQKRILEDVQTPRRKKWKSCSIYQKLLRKKQMMLDGGECCADDFSVNILC